MTPALLAIVALVYVAALVLGMRATALALPQAQEVGFFLAAVAATVSAALLYQPDGGEAGAGQRGRVEKSALVKLGALLAALAVVVGLIAQTLWQPMLRPVVSLSIAAVATLAAPFILFPIIRRFRSERTLVGPRRELGEMQILVTAGVALLVLIIASFLPVPGRSSVRIVGKSFPSLFIGLPEWEAEQNLATMDFGSIKLKDPNNPAERFLAVRWMDSDPVQADDHVQTIAVGGLVVRDRSPAFVGRHEGTTFYLESDDRLSRAAATVWNCPQDHRVLWIFSHLSGPKSAMLATHEKIVKNVHCHTGRNMEAAGAATQQVFPSFAPPPGFSREETKGGIPVYVGENGAEIAFDPALPGRWDVINDDVSPDLISKLLVSSDMMLQVSEPPTLTNVNDLHGHQRRVWSVTGKNASRDAVQMEVMIWHCDKRDMTYIGRYVAPLPDGRHEPRVGVDALLPSACHSE